MRGFNVSNRPGMLNMFLALAICVAGPSYASALKTEIRNKDGTAIVGRKGQEVLLYRFKTVEYKPYVKVLCTPQGVNVLDDNIPDHKHHHGWMLALGAESGDFWGEHSPKECGSEVTQDLKKTHRHMSDGSKWDGLAEKLDWRSPAPNCESLLSEERILLVKPGEGMTPTLVHWASSLSAAKDRTKTALWGRHYFGLGMRFVPDMVGGEFLSADDRQGTVVRGEEELTPARWLAYRAQVKGMPVTVAMFDHPLNPRSPCTWFTMPRPFAYLSATLNLEKQPRDVTPEHPLSFQYGVALWDGHVTIEVIEKAWQEWVSQFNPLGDRVNVAAQESGATALASSEFGPDYGSGNAIDGRYAIREKDKWNSKSNITPHFLRIDLQHPQPIDRVVIRHEGVIPGGDAFLCNTQDFHVQGSLQPWGPWQELVSPVFGNQDNVTVHALTCPIVVQFVRILIETGEQNQRNEFGRLPEVEVYGPPCDRTCSGEEKK